MSFLRNIFRKKQLPEDKIVQPLEPHNEKSARDYSTMLVEDIVETLRQAPPMTPVCHVVLFGDRPLTAKLQGECILCFTQRTRAEEFMNGYQDIYYSTKPLSVLQLGEISQLWAMLNNKAKDGDYEPPYGLLINFNYKGQPYGKYSVNELGNIGFEGFKKGFSAFPG
jgi:hypothetical protein